MYSLPLPPGPKRPQAGHADARLPGCTHQRMTRLYDKYGATPCSVCRKHPAIGWLYRCTQDTDGFLPLSDFGDEPAVETDDPDNEQVVPLLLQNDAVQSPVQDCSRPTTRSSTEQDSAVFSSIPESTTFSTVATSMSMDDELQAAYDWQEVYKGWEADQPRLQQPPIPACGFRVCLKCRPLFRERAMQSLSGVLDNPQMPPPWELDNRRVSDARVLRTIGLPLSCAGLSHTDHGHNGACFVRHDTNKAHSD